MPLILPFATHAVISRDRAKRCAVKFAALATCYCLLTAGKVSKQSPGWKTQLCKRDISAGRLERQHLRGDTKRSAKQTVQRSHLLSVTICGRADIVEE